MAELKGYTQTSDKDGRANRYVFSGKPSEKIDASKSESFYELKPVQNGASQPQDDDHSERDQSKKKKEDMPMVGVLEVFRFSDWKDRLMMFLGSLCALANGAALPALIVVFGDMIDVFIDTGKLANFLQRIQEFLTASNLTAAAVSKDTSLLLNNCTELETFYQHNITCKDIPLANGIMDAMTTFAIYYCIIGIGVQVVGYVQVAMWMTAAERQAHRIRQEFLKNIMRQDIGWFDTHEVSELNTRLADDVLKIQEGIGDKMGSFLQFVAAFITGIAIGFVYGWKLTLVILAVSPLLAGAAGLFSKLAASMTTKELEAYAKAGAVAEEVFGTIRTVVAFGGQEKEAQRYYSNLGDAQAFGIKKGFTNGASMGFIWMVIFFCYGLGFWYGAKLVREDADYQVSNMIIVFFSVLIGAFSLGNAAPNLQSLATARGAAYVVFGLIDIESAIDSSSEEGKKPASLTGTIKFQNIHFAYPSRPDIQVLRGMNLEVRPGQTVALVGSSGCGKSTTVQLLLRFYDPLQGQAREGRTTLVIAHRLSTIKNADIIVGLNEGVAAERGTHEELMKQQGIYYQLVMNQSHKEAEEEAELDDAAETQQGKKWGQALSPLKKQTSVVDDKDEKEEDEKLPNAPFTRLIKLNSPEWCLILLGCISGLINGGIQPAFAILFSKILGVFSLPLKEQEERVALYCILFAGLGVLSMLTMFIQVCY